MACSSVPAMNLAVALSVSLGLALAACGDDGPETPAGLLDQLNALPGVTAVEEPTDLALYSYFILRFEQPVDHADPDGPKFQQRVSLLHRDQAAPMVALTSGYWDYYGDYEYELTRILSASQISIEHRYFGESRPDPADWSKLTIEQMAADQHRIIAALRTIYPGAFVTTGGSKGGMTAVYHRRFYPDDVDGTVPYVAPLSFGAPDARYAAFVDTLGPDACRQQVRAIATELLANRRAAIEQRAQAQAASRMLAYTRIPLAPAVESSIGSLEWAFWQYVGVDGCDGLPLTTASDDDLFDFLDAISPIADNSDDSIAQFDAYFHQAYHQLGYPDVGAAYLEPYFMFDDAAYDGALPAPKPTYDGGAAMRDIDEFVRTQGDRFLFVYGQWDPWTGGPFSLGDATDSLLLVQPEGTHGSRINRLAVPDRDAAFAKLAAWTGVTPVSPAGLREVPHEPREPRIPSGVLRALRAH